MIADLEELHEAVFVAWQAATVLVSIVTEIVRISAKKSGSS